MLTPSPRRTVGNLTKLRGFASEDVFRSVDPPWMAVVAAATGMYLCAVLKISYGAKPAP
jgi:hypothetical protein